MEGWFVEGASGFGDAWRPNHAHRTLSRIVPENSTGSWPTMATTDRSQRRLRERMSMPGAVREAGRGRLWVDA